MKSFTLATACAVLVLSLAACGPKKLTPAELRDAKYAAYEFTTKLNGKLVDCMDTDSDKNKSVTCTARIPTPTALGGHKLENTDLECGYTPGATCKFKRK